MPQEATLLRQQGVHFLQGYHFGKPTIEQPWHARHQADQQWGKGQGKRLRYSSAAS